MTTPEGVEYTHAMGIFSVLWILLFVLSLLLLEKTRFARDSGSFSAPAFLGKNDAITRGKIRLFSQNRFRDVFSIFNQYLKQGRSQILAWNKIYTGLYYFNARWYDPKLGRFITEDPIRDGRNWYSYCGNNPVNFIDPLGLRPMVMDNYQEEVKVQEAVHDDSWGSMVWKNMNVSEEVFEATKVSAYLVLNSDTAGGGRMRNLINTDKDVTVLVTSEHKSEASPTNKIMSVLFYGSDVDVYINPTDQHPLSGGAPRSLQSLLAHEFGHANRMVNGTNPLFTYFRELDAVKVDNEYRNSIGVGQRKWYGDWEMPTYDSSQERYLYPDNFLHQSIFGHIWSFYEAK